MDEINTRTVIRLFPPPTEEVKLEGLYLQHAVHNVERHPAPLVYSNFISSLDGRIAITHPNSGHHGVPHAIANRRDWRLFQELAARADVLITSARYVRQLAQGHAQDTLPISDRPGYADLHTWRREQGMAPQPAVVIVSAGLDLPLRLMAQLDRTLYVATGREADPRRISEINACGARILLVGENRQVEGKQLIDALAAEGYKSIYSVAGPGVLETLVQAGRVNRLYLTQVHRLLGGLCYDTLLEGGLLDPPADFELRALYYDQTGGQGGNQFFSIYDATGLD